MLDDVDRRLLSLLQENARLSNAALAKAVGLTTSTVHERVKKLERRGAIERYVALVDADVLGKPVMAFIRLTLGATSADYVASKSSILAFCRAEPDVLECHCVAGDDCYVVKVRAAAPADLEGLIERMRSCTQVSRTTTQIVLSTLKETTKLAPAEARK